MVPEWGFVSAPRSILLACLTVASLLACAAPCREADTRTERRDFELDEQRCESRARKLLGNVDVGDYQSCMHQRGWCSAPDDE